MRYLIPGVNPVPWKAPINTVQRRGSKSFCQSRKHPDTDAYQQQLIDRFSVLYPDVESLGKEWDVELTITFWRDLTPFKRSDGRTGRARKADVSNMVKSTEDALQGILFDNDRQVQSASGIIAHQAMDIEPLLLIELSVVERSDELLRRPTMDDDDIVPHAIQDTQTIKTTNREIKVEDIF